MKFEVEFWYTENYLPTKRHRTPRHRAVCDSIIVDVAEPMTNEFPVAFIVHDYGYEYDHNGDGHWGNTRKEIRCYNGTLYKALKHCEVYSRAEGWAPLESIAWELRINKPYWSGTDEFNEKSIVLSNDKDNVMAMINAMAENYIVYDGKVWIHSKEPMYSIRTFGLGHNHGGTSLSIDYYYNNNIPAKYYFNALQREEAVAYGKKVAAARSDTKSIDDIGKYDFIEVLMPEMVKRNPMKEHSGEDPFMNALEGIIAGSDSAVEAGLLCMAMTAAVVK